MTSKQVAALVFAGALALAVGVALFVHGCAGDEESEFIDITDGSGIATTDDLVDLTWGPKPDCIIKYDADRPGILVNTCSCEFLWDMLGEGWNVTEMPFAHLVYEKECGEITVEVDGE